jgi:hypothetical protein
VTDLFSAVDLNDAAAIATFIVAWLNSYAGGSLG